MVLGGLVMVIDNFIIHLSWFDSESGVMFDFWLW